ncbi:MAG: hypothetical protein PVF91_15280, partial [Chromatiales bacterium]
MNDLEAWQRDNDAFLAAALQWLRLRLTRLADQGQGGLPSAVREPAHPRVKEAGKGPLGWLVCGAKDQKEPGSTPMLPGPSVSEAEIAAAAEAMTAAEAVDPPPALAILG